MKPNNVNHSLNMAKLFYLVFFFLPWHKLPIMEHLLVFKLKAKQLLTFVTISAEMNLPVIIKCDTQRG